MVKWIGKTVLALAILVVGWVFYLWATYIDDYVTKDEAYGFTIGSSKQVVYESAPKNLVDMAVTSNVFFTEIDVTAELASKLGSTPGSQLLIQTRFHPDGFEFYKDKELWVIYLVGGFNNFISFKFCNDKLCEIVRHSQYFDLP